MKIINRILNFDKQDWKHCWWLFRHMIKSFVLWQFDDSDEAWVLLKMHLTHDSHRKK